jgi:L-lactate dehydrogenase (cytochrome)
MWDTFRSVVRFRKFETDPVARRLRTAITVEDMRRIAKRRLPRGVFDYIDGGAEDERTLANNSAAFGQIEFCPNVLRDVSEIDVSSTLLGKPVSMPLVLAPTGYTRLTHSEGELSVARAAERAGIPYSLSTMSTRSIEEVGSVSNGAKWFQVYTWKDRGLVREMVERAAASGYEAIILTVDTAVLGKRERDARRGFSIPPRIGPGTIIDGIVHPAWTYDFITHDPLTFANVAHLDAIRQRRRHGPRPVRDDELRPEAGVVRRRVAAVVWSGPIVLKGIQTVDDAKRAVERRVRRSPCRTTVVANSTTRRRRSRSSSRRPGGARVEAEIICDGGVRRGSDIVKAIALGATACSIGRPYLYAMGAAGERGCRSDPALLPRGHRPHDGLERRTTIAEIDRSLVRWR